MHVIHELNLCQSDCIWSVCIGPLFCFKTFANILMDVLKNGMKTVAITKETIQNYF